MQRQVLYILFFTTKPIIIFNSTFQRVLAFYVVLINVLMNNKLNDIDKVSNKENIKHL